MNNMRVRLRFANRTYIVYNKKSPAMPGFFYSGQSALSGKQMPINPEVRSNTRGITDGDGGCPLQVTEEGVLATRLPHQCHTGG